jgi:cation-transporting ATPase E
MTTDAPVARDGAATVTGLTTPEVRERVESGRTNRVKERTSRTAGEIVRSNVVTRFNLMLGGLAIAVLLTADWRDALFGWILLINSSIGIAQEMRAKQTLDRLAVLHSPRIRVHRDGSWTEVQPDDLVLDDLVGLRQGDQVPTDGVVVGTEGLEVDEALLTGESDAVPKAQGASVMSGSIVVAGKGEYRTTAVGADAYARKLTAEAKRFVVHVSELQRSVNRLLSWITWSILLVAPLLFAAERSRTTSVGRAVTATAAGIVGMVPQGLVLLTSIAFLLAALDLTRKQVLVQALPAVETLARVDVVCLDKTGTLTDGRIDVGEVVMLDGSGDPTGAGSGPGALPADVTLALGAFGSDPSPNATALAIGRAFEVPSGERRAALGRRVAFSSARKWSAVEVDGVVWVLGAAEFILGPLPSDLAARIDAIASTGRRVVLLGRSGGVLDDQRPGPVAPVALVVLHERIRPDAPDTLRYFADQGVAVKVISGDSPRTVAAVAGAVGVEGLGAVVDGRDLPDDEAALADVVQASSLFGRVTPQQKRAMVRALQSRGRVVAMTGDGVNDALALKDADLGIAMGAGAPATRALAPLVLLDNRFASLPGVLGQGRRVTTNIERVASLFIIKNVYATVLSLSVALAAVMDGDLTFPLLPRHFTVVDALTIGVPAFLLSLGGSGRRYTPGFLDRVLRFSVPIGILVAGAALVAFAVGSAGDAPAADGRSAAVITVCIVGLTTIVVVARPLDVAKWVMVACLSAALVATLSLEPTRSFFALEVDVRAVVAGVATGTSASAVLLGRVRRPRQADRAAR